MLSVSNTDGPTFHTRSQTHQNLTPDTSTVQPSLTNEVLPAQHPTPKSLTADRLQALLQMQKTYPFCKWISKHLSNGKAPQHETDLFTHVKGLLYKHIVDSGQKFLALVIPKSWKYTVLVEAHDKLGHQGKPTPTAWSNVNITGKEWTRILENTLPIEHYVAVIKPKFNITHFRWQRFPADHLIKLQ